MPETKDAILKAIDELAKSKSYPFALGYLQSMFSLLADKADDKDLQEILKLISE